MSYIIIQFLLQIPIKAKIRIIHHFGVINELSNEFNRKRIKKSSRI